MGDNPAVATYHLRIEPSRGWIPIGLDELWEYRELLFFLAWRDIKVRYKQTALGVAWAVLQPLFTMLVFSIFFGRLAGMPSDGIPYPLFTFAALIPWTFFAAGLTQTSNSLVSSAQLLKKVFFPRLLVPMAAQVAGLVDFAFGFAMLLGMMGYYGVSPTLKVLWLPGLLVLALATSLGVGLWLAALNVQFRDIRYVVPFLTQAWLFLTPIVYPSSLLEQKWRTVYAINPMVGVVDGFRWALLGAQTAPSPVLVSSTVAAVALLTSGVYYFRRMEQTFADVV